METISTIKTRTPSRSRRGQANIMVAVVGIVAVIILLAVSVVVVGNIQDSIDTTSASSLPSQARANINATFTQAYNAFSLANVLPLVVAAAAIIGVLVGAFALRAYNLAPKFLQSFR
jgi:hypothetical protein